MAVDTASMVFPKQIKRGLYDIGGRIHNLSHTHTQTHIYKHNLSHTISRTQSLSHTLPDDDDSGSPSFSGNRRTQSLEFRKSVITSSIDGNIKYVPWEFDLKSSRMTGTYGRVQYSAVQGEYFLVRRLR